MPTRSPIAAPRSRMMRITGGEPSTASPPPSATRRTQRDAERLPDRADGEDRDPRDRQLGGPAGRDERPAESQPRRLPEAALEPGHGPQLAEQADLPDGDRARRDGKVAERRGQRDRDR